MAGPHTPCNAEYDDLERRVQFREGGYAPSEDGRKTGFHASWGPLVRDRGQDGLRAIRYLAPRLERNPASDLSHRAGAGMSIHLDGAESYWSVVRAHA